MIPLVYRLREGVRVEEAKESWRVVCDLPLSVLAINEGAAKLLEFARQGETVRALADATGMTEEGALFLCEYFRSRGLLDVAPEADSSGRGGAEDRAGDGHAPRVSVVVPVKDRAADLGECLAALFALDYPGEVEVVVVDDGSRDATAAVASSYPCRLVTNDRTRGPAQSRNIGVARSSGEIVAFIDSDCVADRRWLRELVPYFAWERVAAVGGMVESYFTSTALDRYEAVSSSLSMGRQLVVSLDPGDSFYVPACNFLARRDTYLAVDGMRAELSFGEDVDLCWRLRDRGDVLLYVPCGIVRHKHRNRLRPMLKRRAEYGSSESVLHALHPGKRKRLPLPPLPAASFVALTALLITGEPLLVVAILVPAATDVTRRLLHLRRERVGVPTRSVAFSVLRGHLSLAYYLCFHLVRYHLGATVLAATVFPHLWPVVAFAVAYTVSIDYVTQRPRLMVPTYLGYRVLEHLAYQIGVAAGCLRRRTLRPYGVTWRRERASWPTGAVHTGASG